MANVCPTQRVCAISSLSHAMHLFEKDVFYDVLDFNSTIYIWHEVSLCI